MVLIYLPAYRGGGSETTTAAAASASISAESSQRRPSHSTNGDPAVWGTGSSLETYLNCRWTSSVLGYLEASFWG